MKEITQQHLLNAFGGESMAHMRYLHFANIAEREDFPNVARLFRAIAHAEYIHAGDHYRELKHLDGGFTANSGGTFGPGDTSKNLGLAIMGEAFEVEEMYPVYMEVAKLQGEDGAFKTFNWAYNTEQEHLKMYKKAKEAVDKQIDDEIGPVQVCGVCGYTLEGDAPDKCPICGAKREMFKSFT
ncbi:MAG: Rubrerythrin-2 [Candidatus Lokiarchaeota archaeon]|nr:Rubrerythrin-2 [Candidatus Lokiarchaeota archaeon]MBD3338503.1 Rubrerythrin-2 [Candidatus Lokiarchaeota archaeon]